MDISYDKKIGREIRKVRKSKNLTQEDFSAKLQVNGCDLTRSALAKIEVGQRHIYLDELKTIVEVLEISYNELLK
jgi:transcriptional regulator with XRE-family HTH domain